MYLDELCCFLDISESHALNILKQTGIEIPTPDKNGKIVCNKKIFWKLVSFVVECD